MSSKVHQLLNNQNHYQLIFRNKIIQLEQDLSYYKQKSEEYQNKFHQAIRNPIIQDDQQQSLEYYKITLNDREAQIHQLRLKIIEMQRQKTRQVLNTDLMRENQQLKNAIQEIKEAIIQALNQKDQEINSLRLKIEDQQLINTIHNLSQKNQDLIKINQQNQIKYQKEIQALHEKIVKVTQEFMDKLEQMQQQIHTKKDVQNSLIEKTENLQEDLTYTAQSLQKYQNKVKEAQKSIVLIKIKHQQQVANLKIEFQNFEQKIDSLQRDKQRLQGKLNDYKFKQITYHDQIAVLKQQKQQIKKKRFKRKQTNQKLSASFMCATPQQLSKNIGLFSSFLKGQDIQQKGQNQYQDAFYFKKKQNLGQIKQLNENTMIQNFGGYADIEVQQFDQQILNNDVRKPQNQDITSSFVQKNQRELQEAQQSIIKLSKQINIIQSKYDNLQQALKDKEFELKNAQEKLNKKQERIKQLGKIDLISKQQKKILQNRIQKLLEQMQERTKQNKTLQENIKQKKNALINLQKSIKQKDQQEIIEMQKTRQYMNKLQNSLLSQKLQRAQSQDYFRQKYDKDKADWTEKLVDLTQQVARLEAQIGNKKRNKIKAFSIID